MTRSDADNMATVSVLWGTMNIYTIVDYIHCIVKVLLK